MLLIMSQTLRKTHNNKLFNRSLCGKAEPDALDSLHSTDQGSSGSMFGGRAGRSSAGGGTDFLDHNKADKTANWIIRFKIGYTGNCQGLPSRTKKKKIRFEGTLEDAADAAREHGQNLHSYTRHHPGTSTEYGEIVSCIWEIKEPKTRALCASGKIIG